jgi:1-deoxy-D-xylulose-5-phosphate reductoisomerase
VVHSLVELEDTSMLAQLGLPSMKVPIQYALSYPDRWKNMLKSFDIASAGAMTFEKPDMEVFPCLRYAYDALRIGGSMPAALNAANEVAVDALLQERINFTDIPMILKHMMESHKAVSAPSIDKVLAIDKEIKGMTGSYIEERWHSKRSSR